MITHKTPAEMSDQALLVGFTIARNEVDALIELAEVIGGHDEQHKALIDSITARRDSFQAEMDHRRDQARAEAQNYNQRFSVRTVWSDSVADHRVFDSVTSQRVGGHPTAALAQAECDRRNAADAELHAYQYDIREEDEGTDCWVIIDTMRAVGYQDSSTLSRRIWPGRALAQSIAEYANQTQPHWNVTSDELADEMAIAELDVPVRD